MTVKRSFGIGVFAVLWLALLMPGYAWGEGVVKLIHDLSIYNDGAGKALRDPEDVACLPDGRLLVADTGNGRLLLYDFRGEEPHPRPTEITDPRMSYPVKVGGDADGDLFVLDGRHRKLFRVRPNEGLFEEVVPARGRSLRSPAIKGFALDGRDTIYLLDVANGCVWVQDAGGAPERRIPLPSSLGFASSVTLDAAGGLFLLDSVNARIFSAPPGGERFLPVTGSLTDRVRFPTSLVVGADNRIYVLDRNGSVLLILRRDGSFLGKQLSRGSRDGRLNYPGGICMTEEGALFIADTNNHRVQRFSLAR